MKPIYNIRPSLLLETIKAVLLKYYALHVRDDGDSPPRLELGPNETISFLNDLESDLVRCVAPLLSTPPAGETEQVLQRWNLQPRIEGREGFSAFSALSHPAPSPESQSTASPSPSEGIELMKRACTSIKDFLNEGGSLMGTEEQLLSEMKDFIEAKEMSSRSAMASDERKDGSRHEQSSTNGGGAQMEGRT